MNQSIPRRDFLKQAVVLAAGGTLLPRLRASSANETVRIAVIGCNGRGMNHINALLQVANTEIVCICDVDSRAMQKGIAAVAKKQGRPPRGEIDLRRVFDDAGVDAVAIATPDHWHAPATIMACAAGKHVYVEKPGSHNLRESEWIVAAARKHNRVVQMGNQRRSWPWVAEAMAALHVGELGKLFFARGWYTNKRPPIGKGQVVSPPDWLDYSLWQGPAPAVTYRNHLIHYNWHWFWNWGTGELGNNGVHALDIARWGLGVDLPNRITCGGGRYHYPDEWETPDTIVATFDFGDKGIVWEGQSCDLRGFEGSGFGVTFFGAEGSLVLTNSGATVYDHNQKAVRKINGDRNLFAYDAAHFSNFIEGIRNGTKLAAEIEEGQKSTILCHLGNIAWRTGHTLNFDTAEQKIIGDKPAAALARRSYRRGWEPKI
jgi:predicted dehydrogenase